MTAQMCILLIPSVFSHVFCPLLQPSMAMPIPDKDSTPSLLGWGGQEGLPHWSYQGCHGWGPQQGSSHCRDAVGQQSPPAKTTQSPYSSLLVDPFPWITSIRANRIGTRNNTANVLHFLKSNHLMGKLKITAQANTKILLEQQRKTRGCLAVCKKLRC